MTKNGRQLNIFGKFENAELVENVIPKEGYIPFAHSQQARQINNNQIDDVEPNQFEENNNINVLHENIINTMRQEDNKFENDFDKIDEN